MPQENLPEKSGRNLRSGRTTGSCAAMAAGAAARLLLMGEALQTSTIFTPGGARLTAAMETLALADGASECAVRKDAGDDPDVTDGVMVWARVAKSSSPGIHIDGGAGVGRVTRPGLDQPPGAAAINSVPREMIEREVRAVAAEAGYDGGIDVIVSVPGGEALAAKTFNPNLGVVGGISILGTTGIVNPMSSAAFVDTIAVELRMLRSEGESRVVLVPGNYGEEFAATLPALSGVRAVKCGNFIGAALDLAREIGFGQVLVAGHIGKLIKLSGGIMDTHSRVADARLELLALSALMAGAERGVAERIMAAATADDGLEQLEGASLRAATVKRILERIDLYLRRRLGGSGSGSPFPRAGAALFCRAGLLGLSPAGEEIVKTFGETA